MKKSPLKLSLFFCLLFINNFLFAQQPTLVWAKSMGGTLSEQPNSVIIDGAGNVCSTGPFSGTVDFDPGPGIYNLTATTGVQNTFISKLDASGNFLWAKCFTSSGFNSSNSIALDGSGNIYTTGSFRGTIDLDPGAGAYNFTATPSTYMGSFISKLDPSGNIIWAKCVYGYNSLSGTLDIDVSGNVYSIGRYEGTVDFDPGPGTSNLTSSGLGDIYIYKLDASGNFVWAKSMGGSSEDYGRAIAVDNSGNVYTTGIFQGTADFDPGPGTYNFTSAGSNDIFVSKLDATGNLVWAKTIGKDMSEISACIKLDNSGNVYVSGSFTGTMDFDPGPATYNLTSAGSNDVFIIKLNAAGDLVWARSMGGPGINDVRSICIDAPGSVYAIGFFDGTSDYDPGAAIFNLTSAGSEDIYVLKLNSSGNFVWAVNVGGSSFDIGCALALDPAMNVYAAGSFQGTADFDPGAGSTNRTSAGGDDIFIIKLTPAVVLPVTLSSVKAYQQVSNIAVEWKVENESGIQKYEVEKSTDGTVFNFATSINAIGNRQSAITYNWVDVNAVQGNNYYRIKSISISGRIEYSTIVKVYISQEKPSIAIYPNPLTDGIIHLQMNNMAKGTYFVKLVNSIGQVLLSKTIDHAEGSSSETIVPGKNLAKGSYLLEVTNPGKTISSISIIY